MTEDRGFAGYLGGGRYQTTTEREQGYWIASGVGEPRPMFEFRPADEDCPPRCPRCRPPKLRKPAPSTDRSEGG